MPTEKDDRKKLKNIGAYDYGTDSWMQAFNQLSPEDQAAMFNFAGAPTDSAQQPEGFADQGEGSGLGLPGTGYTIPSSLGGAGADYSTDPAYQGLLQFGGGVGIPQLTSAGNLDPYDLSQEASRVNLMQDNASSLADVVLASLAGPGAIDPNSFNPITTPPENKLKTPGLTLAGRYARGGGYQGFLSQKIANGETDAEAVADMWDLVNAPDSSTLNPQDKAARDELIRSLPNNTKPQQAIPGITPDDPRNAYDQDRITNFAGDLFGKVSQDLAAQESAYQDPQTGTWYEDMPTTVDSPLTKKFRDLGLPTPTAQYTDPMYLDQMMSAANPNAAQENQAETQRQGSQDDIIAKLFQDSQGAGQDYSNQLQGLNTFDKTQQQNRMHPHDIQGLMRNGVPVQGDGTPMPQKPRADLFGTPQHNPLAPVGAVQQSRAPMEQGTPQFSFTDLQGQPGVGSYGTAQTQDMAGHVMDFFKNMPLGAAQADKREKPQLVTRTGTAQAGQNYNSKVKTATDAYSREWGRRNNQISAGRTGEIQALANANFAQQQGRSPYVDAVMQRLLGQRAVGVRGL